MTQEQSHSHQPLEWPEEGEDVERIDPFALHEDDRIYIGRRPLPHGGHEPVVLECFRLGPKNGNERKRTATRTAFDGTVMDVALSEQSGVVTIEELAGDSPRVYWYSEMQEGSISLGNDITVIEGGWCISSSEYVAAIRIVRAKTIQDIDPFELPAGTTITFSDQDGTYHLFLGEVINRVTFPDGASSVKDAGLIAFGQDTHRICQLREGGDQETRFVLVERGSKIALGKPFSVENTGTSHHLTVFTNIRSISISAKS